MFIIYFCVCLFIYYMGLNYCVTAQAVIMLLADSDYSYEIYWNFVLIRILMLPKYLTESISWLLCINKILE